MNLLASLLSVTVLFGKSAVHYKQCITDNICQCICCSEADLRYSRFSTFNVMNPVLACRSIIFMCKDTLLARFICPSEHNQFMVD